MGHVEKQIAINLFQAKGSFVFGINICGCKADSFS